MKLSVYHTPELTPSDTIPDCAIAIDVLRATTTIATALANGAKAVQVFSDLPTLFQTSEQWPPSERLRAGERGGKQVEGCDLGNSPLDCTPEIVRGRRLFLSTTNGTRALKRVETSPILLAGSLINRRALVNYVIQQQPETIWMICSGWEGSFSLEDTICAGAIASGIVETTGLPISQLAANDEAIAALALYLQWKDNLLELLSLASHGKRLLNLDLKEDLKYCAMTDILEVVPIQTELGVLVSNLTKDYQS